MPRSHTPVQYVWTLSYTMGPTPSTYLMATISRHEQEQRFSSEVGGSLCIQGVALEAPDCKAEGNYAARARLAQG